VELQKTRLNETWDRYLNKWDEISIESINVVGKFAHLTTRDGDVIQHIPVDAFEVVKG